jgi:hypothetical protein
MSSNVETNGRILLAAVYEATRNRDSLPRWDRTSLASAGEKDGMSQTEVDHAHEWLIQQRWLEDVAEDYFALTPLGSAEAERMLRNR